MRLALTLGLVLTLTRQGAASSGSHATVRGVASYFDGTIVDQPALVEMTVFGTAVIGDACPDADGGVFVATYYGYMQASPGDDSQATFSAVLYPSSPALHTPSGCPIHDLDDPVVDNVAFTAWTSPTIDACGHACLADVCRAQCQGAWAVLGRGSLTYQVLTDVDRDQLEAGAFSELWATFVFSTPVDASNRAMESL